MAEDELIARARDGDPDAWRELYESLTGRLLVWLKARPSGDVAAAPEDLVSQSWLVAAHSIADFRGDRDAFAGWLFGIARNHAASARRRTLRRATAPTEPIGISELLTGDGAPDLADKVAGAEWTRAVLATLPEREREVLSCTEVAGLSSQQTAVALGMTATAVRVARHRGLSRLRRTVPEVSPTPG
ncbi:RNA polymerase sigma factor [Nocardioides sp. CPCC 206347]|uniref:RNA polymerase sigma factor n=1 Tax=Nocardioides sp. CPCC 206347 TaxID=3406463 RepID=UPI003B428AF7